MRFSLGMLLLLTAIVAAFCFALVFPSPILGDVFYSLCISAVVIAAIAAAARQGEKRCFWLGFGLVTGVYLSLTISLYGSGINQYYALLSYPNSPKGYSRAWFVTSRLLASAYELMTNSDEAPLIRKPGITVEFSSYMTIGHCIFALIFGWLSGYLAQWLYRTRQAPK